MPDLCTAGQRGVIFDLFSEFGYKDTTQMRADAMRILKLDYLSDLRELNRTDADTLIAELRRALAQKRVSDD